MIANLSAGNTTYTTEHLWLPHYHRTAHNYSSTTLQVQTYLFVQCTSSPSHISPNSKFLPHHAMTSVPNTEPTGTHEGVRKRGRLRHDFPVLPKQLATNVPRKVFEWLYSFSLIILMIITFGFVLVTPLDIIMQTVSKKAAAIKLFIIIIACATFVLFSLLFYFSRLYHSRVLFNRIPAKSVYLPLEKDDLPPSVQKYIEKTLQHCVGDVKVRAGPLANEKELFNYPGRVAPKYIQRRNIELALQRDYFLLPEDHSYQDIIDSIGLKLRLDGMFANTYSIPKDMTFREIFVSLFPSLGEDNDLAQEMAAAARRAILTYERAKYSGELIELEELVEFFVDLEKVVTHCYTAAPMSTLSNTLDDVERLHDQVDRLSIYARNSLGRRSTQLIAPSLDEADEGERDWGHRPNYSVDSGDVMPYLPATSKHDLNRVDLLYSQGESNISLTSSVVRVPAQPTGRSRSNTWDFLNNSKRFLSTNF